MLNKIATWLIDNKKKFYALAGDYIGAGGSIVQNSKEAVKKANAIILLHSKAYTKRFRQFADKGAIAAEVTEMIVERRRRNLPVIVISMDSYDLLDDKLPWTALGYDGMVPVVKPLRSATAETIQIVLSDVMNRIASSVGRETKSSWRSRKSRANASIT